MYIFKCLCVIFGVNTKNHIIIMVISKFEYLYNIPDLVIFTMHNIRNKSKHIILMRKYYCNNTFINSMFNIYIYK